MPDRFQESHIRHVPSFTNLPEPLFQKIAQTFVARRYNPGEIIFTEGETTRGMHIFVDGQAVLLATGPNGSRQQIGLVRAGQYINDQAIFRDQPQTATLQAVQPVTALFLARQAFVNLIAYNPDVAQAFGYTSAPTRSKAKNEDRSLPTQRFKTQRENEDVLLITRRHWWAYARWGWVPLLVLVVAYSLGFAIDIGVVRWTALILGTILPLGMVVYLYAEWSNDAMIITDQRIIRITHTILTFTEVVNELAIESVQEANAEVPSLDPFALFFRYGNVELKTAGREGNLILDFVPNPDSVQDLILEDQRQRVVQINNREKQEMRAELDRWINAPGGAQQPFTQSNGSPNAADESKMQRLWSEGDGPRSPFISSFRTDNGGQVYRKHWIMWLRRVMMPGLFLLGTVVVGFVVLIVQPIAGLGVIAFAGVFVAFLIGAVWFYLADWDWRHDYYLVTDTHINIIYQRPFWLQNENDQILLRQVDNVVAESKGILQRVLGYGDVRIALVGADESKLFDNVGDPLAVQGEISRRQARMRQREENAIADQQRELLGEYFSLYHEAVGGQANYVPPQTGYAYTDASDINPQTAAPPQQAYQPQSPRRLDRNNQPPAAYSGVQPAQDTYIPPQPTTPTYQPAPTTTPGNAQRPARPAISSGRRYQPIQQSRPNPAPPQPSRDVPLPQRPPQMPGQQSNPTRGPVGDGSDRPEKFPRRRPPLPPT